MIERWKFSSHDHFTLPVPVDGIVLNEAGTGNDQVAGRTAPSTDTAVLTRSLALRPTNSGIRVLHSNPHFRTNKIQKTSYC